ncbi:TadE/TadG family type IV pilus assembly protein [Novosphingobium rosa]|uniref:TadE/TadG family type IV pilus assembly protein n=1 Tax=Novosphingobium rosa TaxID=76978 RepID=UPI00082FB3F7|nr:TadE/TadG family type IV pilus assembly protein [Novosphingobium rosa]
MVRAPILSALMADRSGAAAVEMALIMPAMLALMFTCMEGGVYLYTEHQVIKGVRDGARFAGRQRFTSISCTQNPSATLTTTIQNVTVYGKVSPGTGDAPRISTWTVPDTTGQSNTTISVSCASANAVSGTGSYTGLYAVLGGAPVVTISARVRYPTLFSRITGIPAAMYVGASDQAAVMGV